MKKYILIVGALLTFYLPRILEFVGLAGSPDDLNSWGRIMSDFGTINVVALLILLLAIWLFIQDYRERRTTNIKHKVAEYYFPSFSDHLFKKIVFYDPLHSICHLSQMYPIAGIDADPSMRSVTMIEGVRARAMNNSRKPITIRSCYAKSMITGDKVSASVDHIKNFESMEIQPQGFFDVFAPVRKFK